MGLAFVPALLPVALAYIGLNALYSFKLKHVAVIDIFIVAMFYLLRVVAGGVATGLPLSPWIILCVLFGALFIIVGKRRAEANLASRRSVLNSYSKEALDAMLNITAGLAIISYGLYSILGHNSPYLVYSAIFVALVFFRMLNHIYLRPHDAESPELLVFKDRWILGSFVAWVVYVFWIFYLAPVL
jgi:4-hydroxybenzoate polyprenyltransferase